MPTIRVLKLSPYSVYIWSTLQLGFEQRLKFTSFKVVIVLKDLDAKNESRFVRCPGTSKVDLSLMKCQKSWQHVFFFAFWWDDSAKVIAPCFPKFTKRGDVVTKHVCAGSSLDRAAHAAAPCGGHSCSFVFRRETRCVTHALLAELWGGPRQLWRTLWESVQAQTAGGIETNVGGIPGHYCFLVDGLLPSKWHAV